MTNPWYLVSKIVRYLVSAGEHLKLKQMYPQLIKKKKKKNQSNKTILVQRKTYLVHLICIIFVIIRKAYTLSRRKEKIWHSIYLIFFRKKKTHITIRGISASLIFFPFFFPTSIFKKKRRSPADRENNGEKIESKEYSLVDH